MKVWLYLERKQAVLGQIRWTISTQIVKPEALDKDEIDIDEDLQERYWGFPDEAKARSYAAEVIKRNDLAFGAVTLQKQVVGWFVEEDRVAEWQDVGESEEITL